MSPVPTEADHSARTMLAMPAVAAAVITLVVTLLTGGSLFGLAAGGFVLLGGVTGWLVRRARG